MKTKSKTETETPDPECVCTQFGNKLTDVLALASDARDAVDAAYAAERSRYRSVELTRAAQSLDTLVSSALALRPCSRVNQ